MKTIEVLRKEKTSIILIFIGVILTGIALLFFLWSDIDFTISKSINSEKFGQFGDFIGGIVGSIWALAGVLLFYIALTEQRKDIKINQDALNLQIKALQQQVTEFELQRNELESSRKVYEEQSKTQKIQQFESNFYSVLKVYSDIKEKLNNLDENKDFFKKIYEELIESYDNGLSLEEKHLNIIEKYTELFNRHRGYLSHYFKCFYRIIKIIDLDYIFDEKTKVFYAKILRSQLTDYEQLILFYNSHSIYGIKARPLILKYNLLKHTPLFDKPEFKYFLSEQKNNNILFFADFLNQFLTKHINDSFDLSFDTEKIEESFSIFNCIIGIYFYEDIELKIYCDKNLESNNIKLTENQLSDFLLHLVYDKVILCTYVEPQNITLTKFRTEIGDKVVYGIKIIASTGFSINYDKF